MFGRLPCLYDSWLTFARNETPQAALNECTCQYCPILFNSFILLIYDDIRKKGNISVGHIFKHCFEQLNPRASYVLAICGLSRLDIKTYSSINSSAVYPTSTQPLHLSDWWSVLCMLARPIRMHHPAAKRHPTLQHLHRLSWRAGKVGCLGTADL